MGCCAFSKYENIKECLCYEIDPNSKIKSKNILCLYAIENPNILYEYLTKREIDIKKRYKIYNFIDKYLSRVKVYENGLIKIHGALCIFEDKFKDLQKSCQFLIEKEYSDITERRINILNKIITLEFKKLTADVIAKFYLAKTIDKLNKR